VSNTALAKVEIHMLSEYDVQNLIAFISVYGGNKYAASETINSKNGPDNTPDREKNSVVHRARSNQILILGPGLV
jgi:hypothetical protein